MEKKTILIICVVIILVLLAIIFGLHILAPALDPIAFDMTKIFICGTICGLLIGVGLGIRVEKTVKKEEREYHI